MIKTIDKLDEVLDFAWELSHNNLYASYPRLNSIEELKKALEKALNLEDRNIIACYHQDVLCGVCYYYWLSDDKYVQTAGFLIRENYEQVADEFINHISKQLPGYELLIGVPFTNENANRYFTKKNFELLDSSIVTALYDLKSRGKESHSQVEKITHNNFEEYAPFHDKYAIPIKMYYNSQNLLKAIDCFRIFTFRQDGEIRGSMFTRVSEDQGDVVGLFVHEEYKNKGIESILINETLMELYNEFGSIREILFFIEEDDEDCPFQLEAAFKAGFGIKEKYRLYKHIL